MTPERTAEVYERIRELKEQKDVLILAHLYQSLEVQKIADHTGDSFELAKKAKASERKNIIFCGVKFMAESAKILNPDKHVFLPSKNAGCAMADMVTPDDILRLKAQHPNAAVVCYINSSAATKALCDMCVTSSNALKIVSKMPQKEIIFVPDKNLGGYIAEHVPEKTFHIHSGFCPIHENLSAEAVRKAKAENPGAKILLHPECPKKTAELADFVGSTAAMLDYVKNSSDSAFIIGTEKTICEKLSEELPDKKFILPDSALVCGDMHLTSAEDVLRTLETLDDEVVLDGNVMTSARRCLENMLEAGKN